MGIGDAITEVTSSFARNREDILQRQIIAEQNRISTDLQVGLYTQMDEDFNNLPAGQFDAQSYVDKFTIESDRILSSVSDKRTKAIFQNSLTSIKGDLALKAHHFELRSQAAAEANSVASFNDAYTQSGIADINNGLDYRQSIATMFDAAEMMKEGLSFTSQQDLEQVKSDYVVKMQHVNDQKLASQWLAGNITTEEYEESLSASKSFIESLPLMADQRLAINDGIERQRARAVDDLTNSKIKGIKENFEGEKQRYFATGSFSKNYLPELMRYAKVDSSLNRLVKEIDIMQRSRPFFNALYVGDFNGMKAELDKAKAELRNSGDISGLEYQKRNERYNQLNGEFVRAYQQLQTNFADFYKNDPGIRGAKAIGQQTGNYSQYIAMLESKASRMGIEPTTIELLDTEDLRAFKGTIKTGGTREVQGLLLSLNTLYGKAMPRVLQQLTQGDQSATAAALKRYEDDNFPQFLAAARLSKDDISTAKGAMGDDAKKVTKRVAAEMQDYFDWIRSSGSTTAASAISAELSLAEALTYQNYLAGVATDPATVANSLLDKNYQIKKSNNGNNVLLLPNELSDLAKITASRSDLARTLIREEIAKGAQTLPSGQNIKTPLPKKGKSTLENLVPGVMVFKTLQQEFGDPSSSNDINLIDTLSRKARVVTAPDKSGIYVLYDTQSAREDLPDEPLIFQETGMIYRSWEDLERSATERASQFEAVKPTPGFGGISQ